MKKLWMLHIEGPDDLVAAPSKEDADRAAKTLNQIYAIVRAERARAGITANGKNLYNYPNVKAVVAEWNGTPDAHVESVARDWPGYDVSMQ